MELLIIDRGNTRTKLAAFSGKELVCVRSYEELTDVELSQFITQHPATAAIISSTGEDVTDLLHGLKTYGIKRIVNLDHTTPIPIKSSYQTPETLGTDRLAAAIGAADLIPNKDLLIFDFGTAITVDFLSADGEFKGGNISPGLAMRFAALHRFTKRLPLIEAGNWPKSSNSFAVSTHEAIYRGVINGICHEIEGYITENPEKTIFFTGGDALFFEKQIKKPIFADSEATLRGLRVILENLCSNE